MQHQDNTISGSTYQMIKCRTNTDIMNTLEAQDEIDFWNLNNGITLLTSSATLYDDTIEAENIQIVNGLQSIFHPPILYFNYNILP